MSRRTLPGSTLCVSVTFIVLFVLQIDAAVAQETTANTAARIDTSTAITAPSAKDSVRLLFDSHGGFKPFRISADDGSRHALLNPDADQPITLYILRSGALLPLVNSPALPPKESDPGYRGPAFTANDIQVQLWGLDLGAKASNWSAVRYEFFNTSSTITTISVRFVLDTWLGESTKEHLSVLPISGDPKIGISDETQVVLQDQEQLLGSQKPGTNDGFWLLLPSSHSAGIIPQRVIAANVRRLQNSDASFELENHRAFNLLPFSVNDSAIGLFYDTLTVLPHQKISIDLVFSNQPDTDASRIAYLANKLFSIKPSTDGLSTPPSNNNVQKTTLRNADQIAKLDALINRLNVMLSDRNYRQGEVESLLQSIAEARKSLQAAP